MSAPDNFAIETVELTKYYGKKRAVEKLTLAVHWGELFAFLGPNGAGKTTTIKILCGLLRPTAGMARVAGLDVTKKALEVKRVLSYIPDELYLYEKLTGREFLRLVGELHHLPRQRTGARIAELAAMFEAEDFLDELTEEYSQGMKRRIALVAALLHDPQVIVIDEPMAGLDPKTVRVVKDTLRRLTAEQGVTVFLSTHTLPVAEELADRVGIIHQGRLIACGPLAALKSENSPENLEDLFLRLTGSSPADGSGSS